MAARTEHRTIGGHKYTVTQMPPSRALPLQMRLGKFLLPVLPALAKMQSEGAAQLAAHAIGAIAGALAEHMTPEEFLALAMELTQGDGQASFVSVDGGPVVFESQFMGDDLVELYEVIGFVLEVNYAKFFTAIVAKLFGQASPSRDPNLKE